MAQVGQGKQAYENAKDFVKEWRHMDLGWVDTNRPPIEVRLDTVSAQALHEPAQMDCIYMVRAATLSRFPVLSTHLLAHK